MGYEGYVEDVLENRSDYGVEGDCWEMVTHLMGVGCAPCLIDLGLDRVFVGELEVDDHLGGAP